MLQIKKIYLDNFGVAGPRSKNTLVSSKNIGHFKSSGFSLIEIMITLAVAAILATMAVPSVTESINNSKVKALSMELTVALHLVQSEAIKRGVQVSIRPQQTNLNEWQTGWDIFSDPNANGIQDTNEELIQTHIIDSEGLTLISESSVFSEWLGFLPSGAATGTNGISGGFRICRADGNNSKARTFIIQATGNIITEIGSSACPS